VSRAGGLGAVVMAGGCVAAPSGWAGVLSILTVWVFVWM